ncbi:MAG: C1 family peptidase [Adlercreutzia equolifaciens]
MDKAERFATHESLPTHAMTIAGVDIKDGKPTKWKIENSWGTENHGMKTGNNGYFVCSDEWFDNFVYEVAIRKDRLSPEMQKALDSDPIGGRSGTPSGFPLRDGNRA